MRKHFWTVLSGLTCLILLVGNVFLCYSVFIGHQYNKGEQPEEVQAQTEVEAEKDKDKDKDRDRENASLKKLLAESRSIQVVLREQLEMVKSAHKAQETALEALKGRLDEVQRDKKALERNLKSERAKVDKFNQALAELDAVKIQWEKEGQRLADLEKKLEGREKAVGLVEKAVAEKTAEKEKHAQEMQKEQERGKRLKSERSLELLKSLNDMRERRGKK